MADRGHWISVETRLPETETDVLCADSWTDDIYIGYQRGGLWFLARNGKTIWGDAVFGDDDYYRITHWMPLPDLPPRPKS